MENLIEVVLKIAVLQTAALAALLWFLVRALVKHKLHKDLEKYKTDLKQASDEATKRLESGLKIANDLQLERYKNDLKQASDEALNRLQSDLKIKNDLRLESYKNDLGMVIHKHNLIFTKLHETRCIIIGKVYAAMIAYKSAASAYVSERTFDTTKPLPERREKCTLAMEVFHEVFYPNEIYFDQEVAKDIRSFEDRLYEILTRFKYEVEENLGDPAAWQETAKLLRTEVQPIFQKIHRDFQEMIGVFEGMSGKT